MTLVVAGHTYEKELRYSWAKREVLSGNDGVKMNPSGLFIATDSVLTAHGSTGLQPVLDGFRKSYPVAIKIWKPYFLDGYFHSYQQVTFESSCFIAFAGSSLVAQHAMNVITTHLGELRITVNSIGKSTVIRDCQKNNLKSAGYSKRWDEDFFFFSEAEKIIAADDIAKHVEHSINVALKSAKKFKTSQATVEAMRTDFSLGVQCPATKSYKLYVFRMCYQFSADGLVVNTCAESVPAGKVAVLGMRQRFEEEAQKTFSTALERGDSPEQAVFDFLNDAIDRVSAEGSFEISRPSSLKVLKSGKFSLKEHKNE